MLRYVVEVVVSAISSGFVSGGVVHLVHASRARRLANAPKIVVTVSEPTRLLYERFAKFKGLTLAEWAKRVLSNAVPKDAVDMMDYAQGKSLDEAFELLDELDKPLGLRSEKDFADQNGVVAHRFLPKHPCQNLDPEVPSLFLAKSIGKVTSDCYGTCKHRTQVGRICLWPPQAAHNCPVFTAATKQATRV